VLDNNVVPYSDMDGEPRIQKGLVLSPYVFVDIGADELDTRPPVTSILLSGTLGMNGWYVSPVTVTLSTTDAWIDNTIPVNSPGTGVAYTEYSLNGVNWTTYTGPFTLSSDGQYLIDDRSADKAGNLELPPPPHAVKIDTLAPTTLSTSPTNGQSNVVSTTPVKVTFSETVQAGSNYGGITVKKGTTLLAFTKGIGGGVLTLTPKPAWPKRSTIIVTVPAGAVNDLAGNPTTAPTSFRFVTGKQ
jgi:hypothetical protein